jgi:hypothetical protein
MLVFFARTQREHA